MAGQLAATVGRTLESARVGGRLAELSAGRGGLVLLSGEAGIGKTRLALDATAAARGRGCRVAWGRCLETGAAPAFWPWVQVVRDVVADEGPDVVRSRLGAAAADVLALTGMPGLAASTPSADLAASTRFRLLDGVVRLLAEAGPVLVVLEDLHRADELSVALVRQLAGDAGRLPVLLLATYRHTDVGDGGPVAAALAEVVALPWCEDLPLGPLPPEDALRLVTALPGTDLDRQAAEAVVARAGGNPLFLQQLARAPGSGTVPRSLREVLRGRLADLPESCRELVDVLAVGGREIEVSRAASAAGLAPAVLPSVLAPAIGHGLLTLEPGERRTSFPHALIQETLYADLDPGRRAELHERYAALLGPAAREDAGLLAAQADHALRAARGGRDVDCVGPLREAARAAAGRLAFAESGRLLREALAECQDRPAEQARVLLELGEAEVHAGRVPEAREHLERAADLAVRHADHRLLAEAALGIGFCVVTVGQVDWGLVDRLRQALDSLGPDAPAVRVRLLARLAVELYWHGGGSESRQVSAEALAAAESLTGDPRTLAEALWARLFTLRGPDRLAERVALGRRLVDLAVQQQDDDLEVRGRVWWLPELLRAGDLPAYRANVARLEVLADRSGQPLHHWYAKLFAAQRALLEGKVTDAAVRSDSAAAEAARLGTGAGEIYRVAQQVVLRRDVGRLDELLEPLRAVADRFPALVTLQMLLVVVQAELGQRQEAAAGLSRLAADDFAAVPPDSLWTTTLCYAAEVARLVGDASTGRLAARLLDPYRGTCAVHGLPVAWGAVDRGVGLARAAGGDLPGGIVALRTALDLHEQWGFRTLVVRTRLDLAEALGTDPEARVQAGRAAREAGKLGAARLVERAAAWEAAARPSRLTGPGGTLSPREMEVLALVAAGASNAGIAARLVLSVNTVERHLRNLYLKLGVSSRAEAAVLAARSELGTAPAGSRADHGFR